MSPVPIYSIIFGKLTNNMRWEIINISDGLIANYMRREILDLSDGIMEEHELMAIFIAVLLIVLVVFLILER